MADQDMGTASIDPGKPCQNGVDECFDGDLAGGCVSLEWLRSRAEAKAVSQPWRGHSKTVCPWSILGNLMPSAVAAKVHHQTATSATATGQDGALHGAAAPRPVAPPSRTGHPKPEAEVPASSQP